MIFPAMMFGLGFVAAALLAWLIMPPVIRSMSRNSSKKRRKIPQNLQQALADKDRLRAEFALSLRKSERKIEKLKRRAHEQLVEIAARDVQIGSLKKEMDKITDLADRRYREREKFRQGLEKAQNAKDMQSPPPEHELPGQDPAGDNVHALEPRDIDLSRVSDMSQSTRKEPVPKGSLASRIRKLKSAE